MIAETRKAELVFVVSGRSGLLYQLFSSDISDDRIEKKTTKTHRDREKSSAIQPATERRRFLRSNRGFNCSLGMW